MVAVQLQSDRIFLRIYTPFLLIDLPLSDFYKDLLTKEETLSTDSCVKDIALLSLTLSTHLSRLGCLHSNSTLQAGIQYSPSYELLASCIHKAQGDL